MANLNIKFNNKNYSIDPAFLADATARLEAHLVAMMDEPAEPELGLPIAWNSMEVMGNASVSFEGAGRFVKVSDWTPLADDLAGTVLRMPDIFGDGEIAEIITLDYTHSEFVTENVLSIMYSWWTPTRSGSEGLMSVLTAGECMGVTFTEPGLYAFDFGSEGYNIDCVIDVAAPTSEEPLEGTVAL